MTLEQQNEIRKRNGLEPLDSLPLTDEEIAAQREQQRLKDEEEERKKNQPTPTPAPVVVAPVAVAELDDNALLAELQKRNPKIKSLSDLAPQKTEEDIQNEKDAREAAKLSWGLTNGRFKKKDYESYIDAAKNPQSIVFNSFAARVTEANPDVTPEEINEQFNERYGLDKDPESWQYKQGQQDLAIIANQHLQSNYGAIMSLENDFSSFERNQNERQSEQAKILANAPAFKRDVEEVFASLGSITTKIGNEDYTIPLPTDFVDRIKNHFLSNEFVSEKAKQGWSKEDLKQLAINTALIENRDFLFEQASKEYALKNAKGARGIVPPRQTGFGKQNKQITADEKQQKAAERHGAVVPSAN